MMTVNPEVCRPFLMHPAELFFLVGADVVRYIRDEYSISLLANRKVVMRWHMFLTLLFSLTLHAKVDPPNYDFSTDTLADFFPGKTVSDLESKYGKADVMRDSNDVRMLRFWVRQLRYKFPIIVQADKEKVIDMFATLPSYFLHDVFHHSVVKRWGKQQDYKRVDEEAYYRWSDSEKVMHYSAACTITCFPLYFSVAPAKDKAPAGFVSQHDQLQAK